MTDDKRQYGISAKDMKLLDDIRRRARTPEQNNLDRAHQVAERRGGTRDAGRSCHTKTKFSSQPKARRAAKDIANRHNEKPMDEYFCEFCERWHLANHKKDQRKGAA